MCSSDLLKRNKGSSFAVGFTKSIGGIGRPEKAPSEVLPAASWLAPEPVQVNAHFVSQNNEQCATDDHHSSSPKSHPQTSLFRIVFLVESESLARVTWAPPELAPTDDRPSPPPEIVPTSGRPSPASSPSSATAVAHPRPLPVVLTRRSCRLLLRSICMLLVRRTELAA